MRLKRSSMSKSETKSDLFGTVVAILIALVSVVGAITAWRVATRLDEAGGADSAGIRATTNKEDITTQATIILDEHLSAFAAYEENKSLADAYDAFARSNSESANLADYASMFRYAANQAWDAIPEAYIDRDGKLDRNRDIGEHIAEYARNKDIDPQSHFDRADASRTSAMWLFMTFILDGMVLILLTTADAIGNWLRYFFLAGGMVLFAIAVMAGLLIELLSALVIK